jgi:hypothetical protein
MGKKKKKTQLVNKDLEQMSERHQSIELKRRRKTTDNKHENLFHSLKLPRSLTRSELLAHIDKRRTREKKRLSLFPSLDDAVLEFSLSHKKAQSTK